MKNKKLLVSLVIVAVIVVIVVVMAAVCTVRDNVYFSYHKFDGNLTSAPNPQDGVPTKVIEEFAKGKSVVFLSKTNLLTQINAKLRAEYPQWYAFAEEKSFPNILNVHLVKVTAIAKLTTSGGVIFLDSFGNRVTEIPDYNCIDITSAIEATTVVETQDGWLKFESRERNERLQYVLQPILATWQC